MILRAPSLGDEVIQGDAALKKLANGTFIPGCVTWRQMAETLEFVAEYGRKIMAAAPFGAVDQDLSRATQACLDLANTWRARAPLPWQTSTKYCVGGLYYDDAIKAMQAVYTNGEGQQGVATTIAAARTELARNLTDPLNPDAFWGVFWKRYRWWIIGGGALVGAGVALPYLKPVLKRIP